MRFIPAAMGNKLVITNKLTPILPAAMGNTLVSTNNALNLTPINESTILLPLSEWNAVHLYNAVLHQCLGSDQLIVTGIVHHIQDTTLASDGYSHKSNINEPMYVYIAHVSLS